MSNRKTDKAVKAKPQTSKKSRKPRKRPSSNFKFTGLDGMDYSITKQQKLFSEMYLEFGANGTDAIIEAGYDVQYKKDGKPTGYDNRKLAAVMATENLVKPNICAYITLKLEEYGFSDDNVERQHLFLVNQNADLTNKRGAIDMFYKLRGNYAPEEKKIKHELTQEILDRIIKD